MPQQKQTTPKSPEDVLAGILKLSPESVGDLGLRACASSYLAADHPAPAFLRGRVERNIDFKIVAKDRADYKHLEDAFQMGQGFGSLHLVSWSVQLASNYWLVSAEAVLLRGAETKLLIHSFAP